MPERTRGPHVSDFERTVVEAVAKTEHKETQKGEVLFLMREILDQFNRVMEMSAEELSQDQRDGKNEEKDKRMGVIRKFFDRIKEIREEHPDEVHQVLNPIILDLNYPKSSQEDNPEVKSFVGMLEEYRSRGYKDGERIFELDGKDVLRSEAHPQGVVVQKGDKIILNGSKLLYQGKCTDWYVHPEGVVVKKGKKLLINGEKLIYEGKCDNAWSSEKGFMVAGGGKLFKDGELWLQDPNNTTFGPHVKGTVATYHADYFVSYAINHIPLNNKGGTRNFHERVSKFHYVGPHPKGLMFLETMALTEKKDIIGKGKQATLALAEPSEESVNPEGVFEHWKIVGEYWRVTPLREDTSARQVHLHPQGFTLTEGKRVFLNDQVVYDGDFQTYKNHQDGVIVKNNDEWRLHTGNSQEKQ
ncbi:MAG: hypothetical protein A3B90_02840 [Candidatus Magasanikbacteria bacterium RIFCSPHIGHO2_02_FULL_41_13]|uniref:Uncharacterized protein n=1 Tax=Candidatus Magasanikbacteria bacterium RIFCSPHIGHO2_02_FULL_41_13 TaxID=1798676 RepID=A0A1F6M3M3_9BACT|nr:MAG: hypothetical protein A3B90_02840 [Candidatus Magasanikbacteria bacterium RIFCSPHIGHO2_02_FULL_41_13]